MKKFLIELFGTHFSGMTIQNAMNEFNKNQLDDHLVSISFNDVNIIVLNFGNIIKA